MLITWLRAVLAILPKVFACRRLRPDILKLVARFLHRDSRALAESCSWTHQEKRWSDSSFYPEVVRWLFRYSHVFRLEQTHRFCHLR